MPEGRSQRRLAAIMAADVVGYSRLMRADEEGTLARLKSMLRVIVDPRIADHGGRIVKLMGDGLLVEFASVVDAVPGSLRLTFTFELAREEADKLRRLFDRDRDGRLSDEEAAPLRTFLEKRALGTLALRVDDAELPRRRVSLETLRVMEFRESTEIRVVESAGQILDEAALEAARTWRFEPALKDGVKVRVRWQVRQRFQIK